MLAQHRYTKHTSSSTSLSGGHRQCCVHEEEPNAIYYVTYVTYIMDQVVKSGGGNSYERHEKKGL